MVRSELRTLKGGDIGSDGFAQTANRYWTVLRSNVRAAIALR